MVKAELPSSGSESDTQLTQLTPLAASTQKTPPKKIKIERGHDSDGTSSDTPNVFQTSPVSNFSKSMKITEEKYLNKFPSVRFCQPNYNVDIDLSDSSDEVWIVKCPSSIDAKKVLLGSKFEKISSESSVSKISSSRQNHQLEGVLINNDCKKPVTIMAGTDFKSFVPVGTIQIRETLEMAHIDINVSTVDDSQEIPFPENIRVIHPLLGFDYERTQKVSKHVKKALSLARQRSEAFYLQKKDVTPREIVNMESNSTPPRKEITSKKRKHREVLLDEDFVDYTSSTVSIQTMIKEEVPSSPSRKKAKLEKISAANDDLSWLNDM